MSLLRFASTGALVVALGGCVGTETGNPEAQARLRFVADTSDPARVGFEPGSTQLAVSAASLSIASIVLYTCDESELRPVTAAADVVQLVDDGSEFGLPPGDYCGLLAELRSDATGAPTFALDATTANQEGIYVETPTPLQIRLLAPPQQLFAVEPNSSWLVGIDLATVLSGVPFMEAPVGADGIRRLDPERTPELTTLVEANVSVSATLYFDAAADGLTSNDRAVATPQ